jgi:hypothetical protein
MKNDFLKAGKSFLTMSSIAMVLSIALVSLMPNQALATYRIPSGVSLDPAAALNPGHVVAQTVIANDTQWAYYISVPTTYSASGTKLWPCIIYMATAECNYNGSGTENTIMTTHCWNGGLAEVAQTPAQAYAWIDRFVVITPYVDEPMIGANQGGKPEQLVGLINYMKRNMKIDSTQISLMGACWGSGVCWNLATVFPNIPSCMVLMDGNDTWCSTYRVSAACKLTGIPIKLLAASPGSESDSILMTGAHNAIQACGSNKETITYYKCGVHEMWSGSLMCGGVGSDTIKSIFDWMLTNKLTTSVEPRIDENQNSKAAPISLNSISATDKVEVIGLNGKILLRSQGVLSKNDRILSTVNRGAAVVRITHADQSIDRGVISKW